MDFFGSLPDDVVERVLNQLDLPEINIVRVLDRGFYSMISDSQFVSQYNRNRVSRLWIFTHVCDSGDDAGLLMPSRLDEDESEWDLRLPLAISPGVKDGDDLTLVTLCGSLFLFHRRTPHPDDEQYILEESLCVVNPFCRRVLSVEIPTGLLFDGTGFVRFSFDRAGFHEQQHLHFVVSYLRLNDNQVPTFSEFRSYTNRWEYLLLEAAPVAYNQQLNTHDPRAMIHTEDEITYLVSFLDGRLVFRTVPTNILIGNTFQGLPVPQPPDGRIMVELLVVRGAWAFMLFCHSPQDLPHLSSIAAVALARFRQDWTGFDLINVTPPGSLSNDLVYIRLDAGFQVHQTGRHINLGMVTSDFDMVSSIRMFSYDLLSREWRDIKTVYDEDVDVAPPLCSNMLTL